MNERLQEVLAQTLEKATAVGGEVYDATKAGLGKAVDFAQEQIPDVIAQLMKWEFAYHAMWTVIWLITMVVILIIGRKFWKASLTKSDNCSYSDLCSSRTAHRLPTFASVFLALVILFNGFSYNASQCAKVYFAPKVFLLEYCSDLVHVRQANAKLGPNDIKYQVKHNH